MRAAMDWLQERDAAVMKLPNPELGHLTYCTNIHAGETWPEVFSNLRRHLPAIKAQVAPGHDFGVGLRLSAIGRRGVARARGLGRAAGDFWTPTASTCSPSTAFPMARFTASGSRSRSISPTGSTPSALAYTDRLADLLVQLLPDDPTLDGSVSTVPGTFKPRRRGAGRGGADRAPT